MKVNLPMLVLFDNIRAIEMLDMKMGKCRMKHVDTRYHWITQFVDDEIVDVKYIKSENNVADICTKNLQPKLFEKHSSELISDVGFFVRCDKTKFPQKKILRWYSRSNRFVRWRMLPGYIMQRAKWWPDEEDTNREKYREVIFIGNIWQIAHYIMKVVQGPI